MFCVILAADSAVWRPKARFPCRPFSILYVDAVNGSDNNVGSTSDAPLQTLSKALSNIAENGTIVLLSNCTANEARVQKDHLTIKSKDGEKYCLTLETTRLMSGVTQMTLDSLLLDVKYIPYSSSSPSAASLLLKNCSGAISATMNDINEVTLEKSEIGGTVYVASKFTLKDSTFTGTFHTKDFAAEGQCTLETIHNSPSKISGTITDDSSVVQVKPAQLQRGELLLEVPDSFSDELVEKLALSDDQSGFYAIQRCKLYNGTYLGVAHRINSANGQLSIWQDPVLGGSVKDLYRNWRGFNWSGSISDSDISAPDVAWKGKDSSSTWALGEEPELAVTLTAINYSYFDSTFDVTKLKIHSWTDSTQFAPFDDASENRAVVCEVQNGQGISDNGRKYTFTIRYPAVTRMAQTITVDTSDRAATCTELLPARAASAKGTLSYESSNSAVASVDPVTGIITAHTAGEVTIIIRAAQTETYEAAETSYKLIVSHRYAGEWTADEAEHWKECVCGAKGELAAHTDEAATCVAKAKCKICGREYGSWQKEPADTLNRQAPSGGHQNGWPPLFVGKTIRAANKPLKKRQKCLNRISEQCQVGFEEACADRPKSSPDGDLFCREALFACSPAARRAAKSVRKALLRKAAEIGWLRPSDASQEFFDSLNGF